MPALRWRPDSGFEHEMDAARIALEAGVGGFIVFGGTVETVGDLTGTLTREAGRPLLFGSDLERGAGQQIDGLTEFPPPAALAYLNDDRVIETAARITAIEARRVGINWIFAPVADLDIEKANPIVQSRSFGSEPGIVARQVRRWVESCQAAGALACAKHYPGHGRTTTDSHAGLPTVAASVEALGVDEAPFLAALQAGVASIMTAHVAFPALDPSGTPATFSTPIIQRLRSSGFQGLLVTDAMIMEGAKRGNEGDAAAAILEAGVDLLLYPENPGLVLEGITRGLADGRLSPATISAALTRYQQALDRTHTIVSAEKLDRSAAPAIADRLLERGLLRGDLPSLQAPLDLVVIDDDVGGPYAPSPGILLPQLLEECGTSVGPGGSRIVLVYAEPRGWKSRAGFSEEAQRKVNVSAPAADLVILFGHPRLAETIPGPAPILLAWHRQELMQSGVTRWLRKFTND
jgi:beta-glucosidase